MLKVLTASRRFVTGNNTHSPAAGTGVSVSIRAERPCVHRP